MARKKPVKHVLTGRKETLLVLARSGEKIKIHYRPYTDKRGKTRRELCGPIERCRS